MKIYYSLIVAIAPLTFLFAQPMVSNYGDNFSFEEEKQIITDVYEKKLGDNGFKFESVTTGINTKYSDYGIGFFKNKFISYSARKIGALARKDPNTDEPFTKLFCSDIINDWDLDRPLLFSYILNKNENLGSLTFSKDGNTLYFTKNKDGNTKRFQLYKAEMDSEKMGRWKNIAPVTFNNVNYSIENPHISPDGKTMYFASNMPGGVGGFDIYQVEILEKGKFGDIVPIKGSINTKEDEKFPHTSVDGKFMFFSSKGHENEGGFDVFKTRRTKNGYVTIVNLGNTINTEKDEIAFIPATDKIGYITSNRDGGNGRYDIYKITEYVKSQKVTGHAVDYESGAFLSDVRVRLIDTDGTEVGVARTDLNGVYTFPISSFEYYTVVADKEGYFSGSTIFNTDNVNSVEDANVSLKIKVVNKPSTEIFKPIRINNINFDFNSVSLKPDATKTLNAVIDALANNVSLTVILEAHTDTRGSADYNLELSKRRASSALKYLLSKGIIENRLRSKGYGESRPLIICDPCTEAEHEMNRRLEFIINQ